MNNKEQFQDFYKRGMEYFKKNNLNEAIELWQKASKLDDSSSDINSILGNAYKMLDDLDSSSKYLEKAIEIEPTNFKYLYNYGLILFEQKRYMESLHIFRKALKQQPQNFELLNDLGVVYFQLAEYDNAIDVLKESLEIEETYLAAGVNLCYAFIEVDNLRSASILLNKLKTKHQSSIEVVELSKLLDVINQNPNKEKVTIPTKLEFSEKIFQIKPIELIQDFHSKTIHKEIDLSIVVPIYNEEDNIKPLYDKLNQVLLNLRQNYEIILVDDGSSDRSLEIMKNYAQKDEHLKIIQFRRNYGQTAALSAGFKYSHGKVIITLDGDLQNDPADIPKLLEKMAEGYDLVNGWRKNRQDKAITRKLPSKIANRIINKLIAGTGIQLNDFGCTLKAYKRGIVKNIKLYGEMHRFIPVFAAWIGVRVTEIPVNHHPRIHGTAKYNLSRVSRVIFDLLVIRFFSDYMTRPIQFFGKISKKMMSYGIPILMILTIMKFKFSFGFTYDTLFIMLGMLSFTSFQILIMGLLGEIMMRSYFEGQNKDYYIVEKIIETG